MILLCRPKRTTAVSEKLQFRSVVSRVVFCFQGAQLYIIYCIEVVIDCMLYDRLVYTGVPDPSTESMGASFVGIRAENVNSL